MHAKYMMPLALGSGLLVGAYDLHTLEVQGPALLLAICGLGLGMLEPRGVWRWALLLGLGVPLAHLLGHLAGAGPPYPTTTASLLLIPQIPAFLGACAGAGARLLASGSNGG